MPPIADFRHADDLSRRRARTLPVLVVVYLSQQLSFFSDTSDAMRTVDIVRVGAWVILSLVLLAALATRGFWLRSRIVRELIDDEVTRANRADALGWGFVIMVATAIALYLLQQLQPMNARETIHATVSVGLGVALLRFAYLERRAHA